MKVTLSSAEIEKAIRIYLDDYCTRGNFSAAATLTWYAHADGPWCLEAEMAEIQPKEPQQ